MRGVAVVDYGVNNIGSVVNMLRRLGVAPLVARAPADLSQATAIILPGIGAFDSGVKNLQRDGMFDALRDAVLGRSLPVLGICLGMQLLTRGSEEGSLPGLNLIPATTRRFAFDATAARLKVPHMGWNEIVCRDRDLFAGFSDRARFYFVHSYHVVCDDEGDIAAQCRYGVDFTAAVRRRLVFGTQFHPEKSHRFGMRLLQNFISIASC